MCLHLRLDNRLLCNLAEGYFLAADSAGSL